jgi:hypothetical protein
MEPFVIAIISALAGLVVVLGCMWRCGVFRSTPPPTENYQAMKNPPEDTASNADVEEACAGCILSDCC